MPELSCCKKAAYPKPRLLGSWASAARPYINGPKRLRTGGLVRLQRRTATGRPSKLSRRQKHRLKQRLQQGALGAGFATDRWTLKRIQQLIERDFAIAYHPNYLARLLKRLGFSVQQPTDRALERDDARVEAWRKRDWPRIKKSPSA